MRRLLLAGALAAAVACVPGCGGEAGGEGGAGDGSAAASPGEQRLRGEGAASERPAPDRNANGRGTADGSVGPDTAADDGRPLRRFRLRVLNAAPDTLRVFAAAGKGEVVLDTVAPADSGDVWLETRASRLQLRAATRTGETLRLDTLDFTEGELHRWRVSDAGGGTG